VPVTEVASEAEEEEYEDGGRSLNGVVGAMGDSGAGAAAEFDDCGDISI